MDRVKGDFQLRLDPPAGRLGRGGFRADHDFAMIEGQNIGRTGQTHELKVQPGDHRIGDESDRDLFEMSQRATALRGKLAAPLQSECRQPLQPSEIQPDASLAIEQHNFHGDRRAGQAALLALVFEIGTGVSRFFSSG